MKDIPETIFLQIDEYGKDAKSFKELETTWCTDKLNEDDIEYILKSKYNELKQQKAELKELLDDAMGVLMHHEQSFDKEWISDYQKCCQRYEQIIT